MIIKFFKVAFRGYNKVFENKVIDKYLIINILKNSYGYLLS